MYLIIALSWGQLTRQGEEFMDEQANTNMK